jgi:hypothetical protein
MQLVPLGFANGILTTECSWYISNLINNIFFKFISIHHCNFNTSVVSLLFKMISIHFRIIVDQYIYLGQLYLFLIQKLVLYSFLDVITGWYVYTWLSLAPFIVS